MILKIERGQAISQFGLAVDSLDKDSAATVSKGQKWLKACTGVSDVLAKKARVRFRQIIIHQQFIYQRIRARLHQRQLVIYVSSNPQRLPFGLP